MRLLMYEVVDVERARDCRRGVPFMPPRIDYQKDSSKLHLMKFFRLYCTLVLLIMLIAGCEKNASVELTEDGAGRAADLDVDNAVVTQEPIDPDVQDSSGFFIPAASRYDGRLTIAGYLYDDSHSQHEVSLARAIFFDRSSPITVGSNGDTIGFRTLDLGTVMLDNIPLQRTIERLMNPRLSLDTAGVSYNLINRDGLGGRGFQYSGNHAYEWSVSGSPGVPSFEATITSPAAIHIAQPTPRDAVSTNGSLKLRWTGGGDAIGITFCTAGISQRRILQLKVKRNTGSVTIPRRLMQLLPAGHARFILELTSEQNKEVHIEGYDRPIIVRAITSHNLLLSVYR